MAYDRLVHLSFLKQWAKIEGNDDDPVLATLIDRLSDLVGRYCGRDNLGNVLPYAEPYFPMSGGNSRLSNSFILMLRHYPVMSIASVTQNGSPISALDLNTIQTGKAGYFLDQGADEPRVLRFQNVWRDGSTPIVVTYTAGYDKGKIPGALQQAVCQSAVEVYKSQAWVGYRSKSLAGETVTFDAGEAWGLSRRSQAMCDPFRNVVPDSWTGQ